MQNLNNNSHYINKNGLHLKEYLKQLLTPEQYIAWCMVNTIKYTVRAGKKEGNSLEKDTRKKLDYLEEVISIREELGVEKPSNEEFGWLLDALEDIKEEFETWSGEEIEPL